MKFKSMILIFTFALLLSGCNSNITDRPNINTSPSPTPTPTPANVQSTPASNKDTSQMQGAFADSTSTSVGINVGKEYKEYPAVASVEKAIDELGIKKGDTVIINLKDNIAQSIEKVVTKTDT